MEASCSLHAVFLHCFNQSQHFLNYATPFSPCAKGLFRSCQTNAFMIHDWDFAMFQSFSIFPVIVFFFGRGWHKQLATCGHYKEENSLNWFSWSQHAWLFILIRNRATGPRAYIPVINAGGDASVKWMFLLILRIIWKWFNSIQNWFFDPHEISKYSTFFTVCVLLMLLILVCPYATKAVIVQGGH